MSTSQFLRVSKVFTFAFLALFLTAGSIERAFGQCSADSKLSAAKKKKCKNGKCKKKAKVKSLAALPDVQSLLKTVKSKSSKASYSAGSIGTREQSGTPPTLLDIAESGEVKDLFWRSGVIDRLNSGSPTEDDCNEFFAGTSDGQSGGLGACFMTQSVGYSFQPIIQSGASLCYMKNAPTKENFTAGGVSLVSGSLPENDPEKLFEVPAGSDRLVKVLVSGMPAEPGSENEEEQGSEEIFIKITAKETNSENGNQYHALLWFCRGSGEDLELSGLNEMTVSNKGLFTSVDKGTDFGSFSAEVRSFLTQSGKEVTFDPARSRTASIFHISEDSFNFKGEIEITPNNLIKTKTYDSSSDNSSRFGYSVSKFSGTGLQNLRFLEGVYKNKNLREESEDNFDGATEYRNSFYAAARENALSNQLSKVDFDEDSFFAEEPTVDIDLSMLSCDEEADVVVAMDFTNTTLLESVMPCMESQIHGMNFCWDNEEVRQAEESFFQFCQGPGPGEGE